LNQASEKLLGRIRHPTDKEDTPRFFVLNDENKGVIRPE